MNAHANAQTQGASLHGEPCLRLFPRHWNMVSWEGTRSALEADGLIPQGLAWPRKAAHARWRTEEFEFTLRRMRPPHLKGPQRLWIDGDYWTLQRMCLHPRARAFGLVDVKWQELRDAIELQSPESMKRWRRFAEACEDVRFQAFKALVPGLVPQRRTRRHPKPSSPAA